MNTIINIQKGIVAIIGDFYNADVEQLKDMRCSINFNIQYGNNPMRHANIQIDTNAFNAMQNKGNMITYLLQQLSITEYSAVFYDEEGVKRLFPNETHIVPDQCTLE